ncbi:hypothetical protein [Chromobacterium haemolyticum]|uniref:hypothetical protein n=1 Tax=Chromobacterium haemolyticum TaxID=394935 RepID=UPI0017475223|nr:hypothetical protein [Chromobacterium haemolyticum]QOD81041.1 hypothetical protein IEZ30_13875 [Chromobacterium haemolyticum]
MTQTSVRLSRWLCGLAAAGLLLTPPAMAETFVPDTLLKSVLYHKTKNHGQADLGGDKIAGAFLKTPGSVYSELNPQPPIINSIEWNNALSDFNRYHRVNLTLDDSVKLFASEMGLNKALPGTDVDLNRRRAGYRQDEDRLVLANAFKAGVDGDIFYKSLDVFGYGYSTIAAKFAVAAQLLRDATQKVPAAKQLQNGIRKEVLDRYLSSATTGVNSLSEYDKHYLMNLLHNEVRRTRFNSAGFKSGQFQPAAQFRVARLAAAYQDRKGYLFDFPCAKDGKNLYPESSGKLCYANMTDQKLSGWYRQLYQQQMKPHPPSEQESSGFQRLAKLLLPIALLMEGMAAAEFFSTLEASELGAEAALTEEEVAATESGYLSRFCRI